jgi:hypothetical protein
MAVGLGVLIPALSAGSIEWGAGRAVTSAGTVFLFTLMASALCWRALRGADQGSSSRT